MPLNPTRPLILLLRTTLQNPHPQCLSRRPIHIHIPSLLPSLTQPRPTLHRPQSQSRNYSTSPPAPKAYTFSEIASLSSTPTPHRIIIDVREPSELLHSGRIPGAYSMPITSNPDAFYLSNEDFFDRFGFEKPRAAENQRGAPPSMQGASTSESPFSPVMKARAADSDSGWVSDSGGGGEVDSEKINREAGYGSHGDGNVRAEAMGDGPDGEVGRGAASEGVEEVIFYCKAGVRSRAAARMAREWAGVSVGDMKGGWMEWEGNGGPVER